MATITRTRTPSQSPTRSRTGRRTRIRSLSLISAIQSPDSTLLTLPIELLLNILELVLPGYKYGPGRLAAVSKAVAEAVEAILYRNVLLCSERQIDRFCNTTRTKPPGFLQVHVKRLAITWQPTDASSTSAPPGNVYRSVNANAGPSLTCARLWEIFLACRGVRSISLPPAYDPAKLAALVRTPGLWDNLAELVVPVYQKDKALSSPEYMTAHLESKHQSFFDQRSDRVRMQVLTGIEAKQVLTHLRICEPGTRWCSPLTMLDTFGEMPELTHLQLSRRAGSNEENDEAFVEAVKTILKSRQRKLRVLAISVFMLPWQTYEGGVESSAIWGAAQGGLEGGCEAGVSERRVRFVEDGMGETCTVSRRRAC